jgi:hypothetical protein
LIRRIFHELSFSSSSFLIVLIWAVDIYLARVISSAYKVVRNIWIVFQLSTFINGSTGFFQMAKPKVPQNHCRCSWANTWGNRYNLKLKNSVILFISFIIFFYIFYVTLSQILNLFFLPFILLCQMLDLLFESTNQSLRWSSSTCRYFSG